MKPKISGCVLYSKSLYLQVEILLEQSDCICGQPQPDGVHVESLQNRIQQGRSLARDETRYLDRGHDLFTLEKVCDPAMQSVARMFEKVAERFYRLTGIVIARKILLVSAFADNALNSATEDSFNKRRDFLRIFRPQFGTGSPGFRCVSYVRDVACPGRYLEFRTPDICTLRHHISLSTSFFICSHSR